MKPADINIRSLTVAHFNPLGVTKKLRLTIVDGADFVIPAGEVVALTGPNGVGKSTLITAVVSPWRRSGGSVTADGKSLRPQDIAYVPQHPASTLLPWASALENATLRLRLQGVKAAAAAQMVRDVMESYQLRIPLELRVDRLSGGQRVRLAIIRALSSATTPKLFVADEPTEGLDAESRLATLRAIKEISEKQIPVLITSHRMDDLEQLHASEYRLHGRPARLSFGGVPVASLNEKAIIEGGSKEASLRPVAEGDLKSVSEDFGLPIILGVVGLLMGGVFWHLLARSIGDVGMLPTPLSVLDQVWHQFRDVEGLSHLTATAIRAGSSLLLALLISIPVGLLLGYDNRLYAAVAVWISILRAAPVWLLVPVAAVVARGRPELQRVLLITLTICLVSVQIISSAAAIAPRRRMELARTFGASFIYRLRLLAWECAAPIAGLFELCIPLTMLVTIFVETMLIPQYGIGGLAFNHMTDRDLSLLMSLILIPGSLGAIATWLVRRVSRHLIVEL